MKNAIYSILSNDSNITSLVGSGADCRIYPLQAEQDDVNPCIVYNLRREPEDDKDGRATIAYHRLEIDIYGSKSAAGYDQAHTLREYVQTALDRYSGTVQSVAIDWIHDLGYDEVYDTEAEAHRIMVDFRIREFVDYISTFLLETGDILLLETGDSLLIE